MQTELWHVHGSYIYSSYNLVSIIEGGFRAARLDKKIREDSKEVLTFDWTLILTLNHIINPLCGFPVSFGCLVITVQSLTLKGCFHIHPLLCYVKPCLQHAYKGLPVCDITASLETSDTCKSVTEVTWNLQFTWRGWGGGGGVSKMTVLWKF